MSDQNKIYEEVAINCSQYCLAAVTTLSKMSVTETMLNAKSCLNCSHFSEEECHCCLDL